MQERMVHKTFQIDESKLERLKALSAKTRVPVSVYIREGVDTVLRHAEAQQRTVETVTKRMEETDG